MNQNDWEVRQTPAVLVIVLVGLVLSLAAFALVRNAAHSAAHALADRQAIQLHDELKARFDHQGLLLRALSGPLAGPAPVTEASFASAVDPLLPLYPDLDAVAWARRIAPRDVPLLEHAMRAAGRTSFAVRSGPAAVPSDPAADLFVNLLVEPRPSGGLVGLDMASLPDQRRVMAQSCAANRIAVVDDPPLRTELGAEMTILYLPVYAREVDTDDGMAGGFAGDRVVCDALSGFLWTGFHLDHLLRDAVRRVGLTVGDAYLLAPGPDAPRLLAAAPGQRHPDEPFSPLTAERLADKAAPAAIARDIAFGGRVWRLLVVPEQATLFGLQNRLAWGMLVSGLLLTVAMAAYVVREAQAKRIQQTEIRARAAMARALRDSEERFRLALRYSKVTLFTQDRDLRHLWVYCPQSDMRPELMVGRTHAELFSPEDAAMLDRIKRPVLDSGVGARHEVELSSHGRHRILDLSIEPMRDETGAVSGIICAAIDVTEAVEIREELARAHREAERANQAKTRFLAAASHDLRQPFQAMSLFHHILLTKLDDPRQLEVAAKLGEALATGNTLLSTLLDTSALEVGNVTPRVVEFAVGEIVDRLAMEIGDQAVSRGLVLRVVPCSVRVSSDPVLLERMVRNLLVNALRYTSHGRILLGCRRRHDPVGGDRLSIEVWDTGPGIPEAEMAAIFEDFYRCGTDQRDSGGGLGLGLSIVRRMAQMLDHPVTVRSRVGHGTVFAISVPLVTEPCRCSVAAE
ncbi:ATP-binding protein [Azospirillum sp. TSO35-2]|uniref:CHASE domain-containing sensor histidine kinase n=1 Tax=Azospirillum sp. TSO35-2 TaxID=716796 RepID=UPI000D6182A6|nr:ATP-binding protein [Azospirillum sp. TSO35-2]PWC32661.1 histidine kinase [Azospirillum sp. TSO35-2]